MRRLSLFWLSVLLFAPAFAADAAPAAMPAASWNVSTQGGFVVSLCRDLAGNTWAGTEDQGVWRYSPPTKKWTQFTTKDGLGDNIVYSLTCDKQGRVWAGTLNHGVSVWNGSAWRNYDTTTGPLGSRVFALAVCPTSGDVWMATEAGLARWSASHDTWAYYTRADGLPSDQASCLAFDKQGNLFVGTMCDGLAVASALSHYQHWRTVTGWDPMPLSPGGDGLPSNLINALLVTKDGAIYAGTTHGLAHSSDGGKAWRFLRGEDWQAQGNGLYNSVALIPADTKGHLLLEDYVTSLAEDEAGNLAVGYRTRGYELVNRAGNRLYPLPEDKPNTDFVACLLPTDGRLLIGRYGGGLTQAANVDDADNKTAQAKTAREKDAPGAFPSLPSPAKPPTTAQLHAMEAQVQSLKDTLPAGGGAYLGEDWQTEGDAIGHYGRQYGRLFAIASPLDQDLTRSQDYKTDAQMGPHRSAGDNLRHWISFSHTQNPNALYSPVDGFRTQAEIDDHGEAYAGNGFGGPDIWVTVEVPEGIHRVSLYFYNKDGHGFTENRYRDYLIELKKFRDNPADVERAPALASARVKDFAGGGVYKSFVVRGPGKYYLKIGKNNSFNTICSAVFIDKLLGPVSPKDNLPLSFMGIIHYKPLGFRLGGNVSESIQNAQNLWLASNMAYSNMKAMQNQTMSRVLAYRAVASERKYTDLLDNWRWDLHWWTQEDRETFTNYMTAANYSLRHGTGRPIQN